MAGRAALVVVCASFTPTLSITATENRNLCSNKNAQAINSPQTLGFVGNLRF
jgi:hypothetical protein